MFFYSLVLSIIHWDAEFSSISQSLRRTACQHPVGHILRQAQRFFSGRGFALGLGKFMQVPDFLHWLLKSRAPFKSIPSGDLCYDQGAWFNSSLHLAGTQGTLAQMLCQVVYLICFLTCFPATVHVVSDCSSAPKANTGVMLGENLQFFAASGFSSLGCQCFKVLLILFAGHHCLIHGLNLIHKVLNGLP